MRKYFVFFIALYFVFALNVQAVDLGTTGFIPGSIWYSKDTLSEGDTVKVYTALWNNSSSPLSAKIEFYDKNVILGTRDIIVPSLSLKETSVSWKVTSGDHSISAKIISPSITASGKKEVVVLDNSTTEISKTFVPVVINTVEGKPATSSDILKSQIDKATSSLDSILPDGVANGTTENVSAVDSFRIDTLKKISETKAEAEKTIESFNKTENTTTPSSGTKKTDNKTSSVKNTTTTDSKVGIVDATEKPIAYLKLFFFSILSFIFGSKIVFYLLIVLVLFFISRAIYRKIRNR